MTRGGVPVVIVGDSGVGVPIKKKVNVRTHSRYSFTFLTETKRWHTTVLYA